MNAIIPIAGTAALLGSALVGGIFFAVTNRATVDLWEHYLGRWTLWNTVRTVAAMMAASLFALGLMQNGAT